MERRRVPKVGASGPKRDAAYAAKILEIRAKGAYANYASDLKSLKDSLGIDVAKEIRANGWRSVLDLGCGRGTALGQLHAEVPGVKFHGLTFHEEPELADLKKQGIDVKVGDWKNIHSLYPPESMDFIYWNYGIDHSLNVATDVFRISKILKKGGRLVFNVNANFTRLVVEANAAIRKAKLRVISETPTVYRGHGHTLNTPGSYSGINYEIVYHEGISFYLEKPR